MISFERATFGNRAGSHQLLETSLIGEESMLEELRFLVDRPAGHIGTEVVWTPYWGCGKLRNWWAIWCGEEDHKAPRKNMVKTHVLLTPIETIDSIENFQNILQLFPFEILESGESPTGLVVDLLVNGIRPVIVPDISIAPKLLLSLWPKLWPAARKKFSLRTYFGNETLENGFVPDIIIIPRELKPRWQSQVVIDRKNPWPITDGVSYFSGKTVPELERLLCVNWKRLPGDFTVLKRIERIASTFRIIREGRGSFSDILVAVRSIEAFDESFVLPSEDLNLLINEISATRDFTIIDIRGASLTKFSIAGKALKDLELATARWIQKNLQNELDENALWILEHQASNDHAAWWQRAIRNGLYEAFKSMNTDWASAVWRWWSLNVDAVEWTQSFFTADISTEASLLKYLPKHLPTKLNTCTIELSAKKQWPRLLAGILYNVESLTEAVRVLRKKVAEPELGLDILLQERKSGEIVDAAIDSKWQPLIAQAVNRTTADIKLLTNVDFYACGATLLLSSHINAGGGLPSQKCDVSFVHHLFDGCIEGDEACQHILSYVGNRAAKAVLSYSKQKALLSALQDECRESLLSAAATEWLDSFMAGEKLSKPVGGIVKRILANARSVLVGGSIENVIEFVTMFPEVSENEVVDLLIAEGFSWKEGHDEKFGHLLLYRKWKFAAKRFRWSWKTELNAVAWYARDLLSGWERFWSNPPLGVEVQAATVQNRIVRRRKDMVKILFFAANPVGSARLAIDEEVRAIEEKVRSARLRDKVEFESKWALRPGDLHQALLEVEPTIVHFSGHGGGPIGIVLHSDAQNQEKLVSSEALADLFKVLKDNIRGVVLNACYSEEQAKAIVEEIDFVVGMADSIGDEAARVFAAGFYQGLAFGRSVQNAFDLGLNDLKLMNLKDDQDVPVLLVRDTVDASEITLVRAEMSDS